jgi:hypothetical protein
VIQRIRQTIWSSVLYRRARRIVADLTWPFRRFEINLMFRQDLTGPVKLIEANVEIDIARASADEVERAGSLIPDSRCSEVFRWRLQNGCMCFVARAGSTLAACN